MSTSPNTDQYRDAAKKKFTNLMAVYDHKHASYWRLANTFDTIIDYLQVIDRDPETAAAVADAVQTQYVKALADLKGYDNVWFDDYGWWSAALQRASVSTSFSDAARKDFADTLQDCWSRFTENAPFVWDRRGTDKYDQCEPAVTVGVWNSYWIGTPAEYHGPRGDPTSGTLQGIQNTVTNTVYLMAGLRLGDTDPKAKAAAEREFAFLWIWYSKPGAPLFRAFSGTQALMRERVGQFRNGNQPLGYQDDWYWAGDLGLTVGALTDWTSRYQQPSVIDHAKALLSGAKALLVDSQGILQNWAGTGNVPDSDDTDYETGTGVFWRNLLYAFANNSVLRNSVISQPEYVKFVSTNADAAAKDVPNETFTSLTQDVAVLTAATVIVPS